MRKLFLVSLCIVSVSMLSACMPFSVLSRNPELIKIISDQLMEGEGSGVDEEEAAVEESSEEQDSATSGQDAEVTGTFAISDIDIDDSFLKGTKWKDYYNSTMEYAEDGTFYWYQDGNVKDDNYYYGKYTVYTGQTALDFVESNNLGGDEQASFIRSLFDGDDKKGLSSVILIDLEQSSFMLQGTEMLTNGRIEHSYIFGLVVNEGKSIFGTNIGTGKVYEFNLVE